MAENVIINNVTYQSVPEVDIPKVGGGTAKFMDTSDATLNSGANMLPNNTAYAGGVKITGSMTTKAAASYTPGTTDQSIAANQYQSGAQTILGDTNLVSANIRAGVQIFGVDGSLAPVTISQDGTTKVLSIS